MKIIKTKSWAYITLAKNGHIDKETFYVLDDRNERQKIDSILEDLELIKENLHIPIHKKIKGNVDYTNSEFGEDIEALEKNQK